MSPSLVLFLLLALLFVEPLDALINATHAPFVCDFADQVRNNPDLSARLWAMAQRELGINPDIDALRNDSFIRDFYGNRGFGFTAHEFNQKPVFYTRIWKSGNTAIRVSLFVYARSINPENFCPGGGNRCSPDDFDFDEENFIKVATDYHTRTRNGINSFSFIRRPVSHFISGLKEYFYLSNSVSVENEKTPAIVSPKVLAEFIYALVDVTNRPPPGVFTEPLDRAHYMHIPYTFPQATAFRSTYGPLLIGRMEHFAEDWRTIQDAFGIDVPINKEFGQRESSKDTAKVGASWARLISSRPEYLRAMCWLLLPDFLCYNYQLPSQCDDIVYNMRYAYLQ